jgi:hypothetical protein
MSFIALAHILSVFKIEQKFDDEGQDGGSLQDVKWSGGMIRLVCILHISGLRSSLGLRSEREVGVPGVCLFVHWIPYDTWHCAAYDAHGIC